VEGVRVNPAMAHLTPRPPGLTIRGDAEVHDLLLDGARATGVRLYDGTEIHAAEVVLAAGAVGTPRLLLRSGIGPGDDLRAAGVAVRHDRPGIGRPSPTTPPSSCRSPPRTHRRTRTPPPSRPRSTWTRARTRQATSRSCCSPARSSPAARCISCAS
jgi:hypothetical protein